MTLMILNVISIPYIYQRIILLQISSRNCKSMIVCSDGENDENDDDDSDEQMEQRKVLRFVAMTIG